MQNKYHICFSITVEDNLREPLLALLTNLGLSAFEETKTTIEAWLDEDMKQEEMLAQVNELTAIIPFNIEVKQIPVQNWNQVWESNFSPVLVDDFCGIRADFHEPLTTVTHEIVISPKQAFGTGHHATTYMMMKQMQQLNFSDKEVFDYGCGTGILAVLASQLGAKIIDAVDIEIESYHNTIEHAEMNHIENIKAIHGVLTDVPQKKYDIILANINRNVILDSLSSLHNRLQPNGYLLISGILQKDEDTIKKAIADAHFKIEEIHYRGDWLCAQLTMA